MSVGSNLGGGNGRELIRASAVPPHPSSVPPKPKQRSKRILLAALGLTIVVACVALLLATLAEEPSGRDDRTAVDRTTPAAQETAATPAPPPAAPPPAPPPAVAPAPLLALANLEAPAHPPTPPATAGAPPPPAAAEAPATATPPHGGPPPSHAPTPAPASKGPAAATGDARRASAAGGPRAADSTRSTAHPDAGAAVASAPPKSASPTAARVTAASATLPMTAASLSHYDAGAVSPPPKASGPDAGATRAEPRTVSGGDSQRRSGGQRLREDEAGLKRVARFVASGGASLRGRAFDAENGRPIDGAIIDARLGDTFVEVETDATGAFRMPGMLPGSRVIVWVIGRADLYVAESVTVSIPGEGDTADMGVVSLIHGNELASRLQGWVGLFVARRGENNVVGAISPWLSADRAGIQVGDVLLSIDGRDVRKLGPRATNFLLRGPAGTKANIVARDGQGARREVELERVIR